MDQRQIENIVRAVLGQMGGTAATNGSATTQVSTSHVDGGSLPDLGRR